MCVDVFETKGEGECAPRSPAMVSRRDSVLRRTRRKTSDMGCKPATATGALLAVSARGIGDLETTTMAALIAEVTRPPSENQHAHRRPDRILSESQSMGLLCNDDIPDESYLTGQRMHSFRERWSRMSDDCHVLNE